MSTSFNALVNPPLLVWAREESGYPPELVADRLKVKPERLLAWERGDLKPTVRQVQLLAKFYHITAVEACRHLDLRFDHFDKLRAELRDRAWSAQTVDDGE
jgi:ribosome-binding protein aMBF1 (putative translation factor)